MKTKLLTHLKGNIFIVLALLSLLISVVIKIFFVNAKAYESYRANVNQKINEELALVESFSSNFKTQITAKNFNFSSFVANFPYTTLVFKHKNLIFWSDNQFLINYEPIANLQGVACLDTKQGIMLVYHERVNDSLDWCMILPIYVKYNIENDYIKSSVNNIFFPDDKISVSHTEEGGFHIKDPKGKFLFSIVFPDGFQYFSFHQYFVVFFALLALFFLYLEFRIVLLDLVEKKYFLKGLWLITLSIVALRGVMLMFNLPNNLIEVDLFASEYFASSVFSPSLGDLILNELGMFVIVAYCFLFHRQILREKNFSISIISILLITFFLLFFGYLMLYHHFYLIKNIYQNSNITLDITERLNSEFFRLSGYLILLLSSISYFFLVHITTEVIEKLAVKFSHIALLLLPSGIISYLFLDETYFLVLFHGLYFLVIYRGSLATSLRQINALTFVYVFSGALVCAITASTAIFIYENKRETLRKEKLGSNLLTENDYIAEYQLNIASKRIATDQMIVNRLMYKTSPKDIVEKKIKKYYLGNHFDKFDIVMHHYDGSGTVPYTESPRYDSLYAYCFKKEYKTNFNNVFFISDSFKKQKTYYTFIDVMTGKEVTGKIIIVLRLKNFIPNSIFPNVLLDKRFNPFQDFENTSYAIFYDKKLVNSFGDYTYGKDFYKKYNNLQPEVNLDGYRHLFVADNSGEKIVVLGTKENDFLRIVSNISILLIMGLIAFSFVVAMYRFYFRKDHFFYGFSVKLQLYLNTAFFLPLIITSLIVISVLNSQNKEEIIKENYEKAENAVQNLVQAMQKYDSDENTERLLEVMVAVADIIQIDVNIFDSKGKLIVSSQQQLYENNLLEPYMSPQAMRIILEQNQKKAIISESIGKLNYHSAHVTINSFRTGERLGVLSVPFFEEKSRFENQIRAVLTSILNIFTLVLLVLSLLAYFISKLLTEPLSLLTKRIQHISLREINEPLQYRSEDEIGILVNEYNSMLIKLEASKIALSQSEKESAWREMAKQVAHEIKNPLTPMRLTLQQLQRVTANDENGAAKRSIETLLGQIETLTDIANSFAAFAKMPIPVEEIFDVAETLNQTIQLYKAEKGHILEINIEQGQFIIKGDNRLLGRIFMNLVINAFQAIPENVYPSVELFLRKDGENKVLISIKDNGSGIDEQISSKIFMPNFTTKSTGSGIGLAVAKRGIEHAGGKIWFETELGIGTTFFIELPLWRE